MTAVSSATVPTRLAEDRPRPWGRVVCAAAAIGAAVPFALSSFSGDSGEEITASLVDGSMPLMAGGLVAVVVAAGLFLAAVRLGRALPGDAGGVVTLAGSAVALTYAAYYASFAAGGVFATQMTDEPGPGVGEATAVLVNAVEIARFAPGLALVAAVLVVGRHLPRWVRVSAGVLTVMTLLPFTGWVAALLVPVWLGATAATLRDEPLS